MRRSPRCVAGAGAREGEGAGVQDLRAINLCVQATGNKICNLAQVGGLREREV